MPGRTSCVFTPGACMAHAKTCLSGRSICEFYAKMAAAAECYKLRDMTSNAHII